MKNLDSCHLKTVHPHFFFNFYFNKSKKILNLKEGNSEMTIQNSSFSNNLVRKIGVCITSEENGESKLTSEENLFNNLLPTY
jgi:hypothetical protein